MSVRILLMLLAGLITASARADVTAFRLVVTRNDIVVGGELHTDVELRIQQGAVPQTLHSLTLDVPYGTELTAWPDEAGTSWSLGATEGYAGSVEKLPQLYRVLVTGGDVNADGSGAPAGWLATANWQPVVNLRWAIAASAPVAIAPKDATLAAAYFVNLSNQPRGLAADADVANLGLYQPPLAVEYGTFSVVAQGNGARLCWRTLQETNNLGFYVYRSTHENGPFERISPDMISGKGTTTESHDYCYLDTQIKPGQTYFYMLEQIDQDGTVHRSSAIAIEVDGEALPASYRLQQNYPNPFNQDTRIAYELPEEADVEITVANVRGEIVRHLLQQRQTAGRYGFLWDGRDDRRIQLSSGIYYLTLAAGEHRSSVKMMILR